MTQSLADKHFAFTVMGATGVTGKRVVERLCHTQSQHNLRWAMAGRSESGLKAIKEWLVVERKLPRAQVEAIPLIIADAANEESLLEMCRVTKVLLQLVGPYRLYGMPIVNAAIARGTHVVDVCGEPDFLERCEFNCSGPAEEAGVTIVGSSGFDSIPADFSSELLAREFTRRGATCAHIDSFLSFSADPAVGACGNSTTFDCIVLGLSSVDELKKLRKAQQAVPAFMHPPRLRMPKSAGVAAGGGSRSMLPVADPRLPPGTRAMDFPGADASIVRRTATRLFRENEAARADARNPNPPPRFHPYSYSAFFTISGWWPVVCLIVCGAVISLLIKFEFGRNLVMKYPELFTAGFFKKGGPTEQQLEKTSFQMKLFGVGWQNDSNGSNNAQLFAAIDEAAASGAPAPNPTVKINLTVSGPEPGYVATPLYLLAMAHEVLEANYPEEAAVAAGGGAAASSAHRATAASNNASNKRVPHGVLTPALALQQPQVLDSFVARLAHSGCHFKIES